MTSTDPAKALAREITNLQRQVSSLSRGSQLAHSSLIVDGETVTVAGTVRTTTTALATANGKNSVTFSAAAASGEGKTSGDIWYQMTGGVVSGAWLWTGTAWEAHTFGDAILDSLTVGKLVSGEIAAGERIIAGPETGTHAEMSSTGFRVFQDDPVDAIPNEVVRMGTTNVDGTPTNDFIGIVSATGELLASIDDSGQGNFQSISITGDATFAGKTLTDMIVDNGSGAVGYFEGFVPATGPDSNFGPIRDRVGIMEVNAMLTPGRRYNLNFKSSWYATVVPASECRYILTYTGPDAAGSDTAPAPLTTSVEVEQWIYPASNARQWQTATGQTTFVPATEGRHRFLLSIERGVAPTDCDIMVVASHKHIITIEDTGPSRPPAGVITQGGGQLYQGPPPPPPPPPTQQYYVDLGPVGKKSWRGDGSLRDDLGGLDIVQGWDPSGYNGDGRGTYWFTLPDITGTVDRVDLYLYASHWYYNSGGTAVIGITDRRGEDSNPPLFKPEWRVGGYPKPGGKTVTLWSDWYPFFRGTGNANYDGRASTIRLGPSGGTDLNYYGRFSDVRLRIWYTQ